MVCLCLQCIVLATFTMLGLLLYLAALPLVQAQTSCTLCPDGSKAQNPDLLIPLFVVNDLRVTCGDVEDLADLFPNCEASVQIHAGFCGCQSFEPVDSCRLCPTGQPSKPDQVTPLNDTCADLDLFSSFLSEETCGTDLFLRGVRAQAALCGCEGVQPICTLCPNGEAPPDPSKEVLGGLTCGQISDIAQTFDQTQCTANARIIEVDSYNCGCEGAQQPPVFCSLCPNQGQPGQPNLELPFGSDGLTCSQVDQFYTSLDEVGCTTYNVLNRIEAKLCDCPNLQEANCTLCPNGDEVGNPNLVVPRKFFTENVSATCDLLDAAADVLDTNCEEDIQSEKGFCGCDGIDPVNACTFCPDGSPPPVLDKVTPLGSTCGEIHDYISYFTADECADTNDRLLNLRLDAFFCDCPGVEPICSMCPGGAPPGTPELVLGQDGDGVTQTCKSIAELASVFGPENCEANRDILNQAAARCACPGVTQACTLCPEGNPPPNPSLSLRDAVTCENAADLVRSLTQAECTSRAEGIANDAFRCGCEGVARPQCKFTENPQLCTEELLATATSSDCECYSFCDGQLVDCDAFEGFARPDCAGEAVYGCNAALALANSQPPISENETPPAATSASAYSKMSWSIAVALLCLAGFLW